ncbi:hypothetical protein BJV82DRAFT_18678 [Fennellomyces sp. T-0311]|nr:hypothetical protein BJV82DRAFT_18678 [Fennellomyces sp. T-0311]
MTPLDGIALDKLFLNAKRTVPRSEEVMVAQKLKEEATKIIEAILSRESPSMFQRSLGYLQSFHKRANAKTRAAKEQIHGEPIVFNLPYDIMESIWSQISLIDRLQCTQVCKVWRTQLLDSAVMWGDVSECNVRDLKPYNINGKDIRQVNLERDPEAIEFLLALKCSNIQSSKCYFFNLYMHRFIHIQ